ncbi:hypothetical protein C453_00490 [Haloferax elongans ATCC BAA-1513]|uniref:Uncharacterized protein n=1 Tax=Haloferax elongans ATCC BAA-1513 TaxID=1230453 RepID=M0I0J7_HALEO|nr:hypothetical protein [Haloferax elongans]ELZ89508.1 hypothetical protein C453_00490 [Haloferax elongans ATCC BAA-1513]
MEATITGEDEVAVGLSVIDNIKSEHLIEMELDGEIYHHQSEAYADNPALRTREECERVDQARRFAKWHVYRDRGYDTVPPIENPDRLLAGLLAITMLSGEGFQRYFGDLEERLASHYDDSSVDLPFPNADPDDAIIYQKDVYLQSNPVEFEPPILDQFLARFEGEPDSLVTDDIRDISSDELDDLVFEIEAVSDTHIVHNDGQGNEQVARREQPLEREPDARVELMAFDPSSVDSFQHYVVSNLAYQIRDRFLLMGVKPPVAFRAQGWGTYEGFQCQKFCSLYEDYWSSEAAITSWNPS